jgi:hypothetical protein
MTYIVAGCNRDGAVLAANARVSSPTGYIDDKYVKVTRYHFRDGWLVGALTGLAGVENFKFETQRWLAQTIPMIANPQQTTLEFLSGLNDQLTTVFQGHTLLSSIPPAEKKLTIIFVGYVEDAAFAAIVSNCEDHNGPRGPHDFFVLTKLRARDASAATFGVFGARPATNPDQYRELWSMFDMRAATVSELSRRARKMVQDAAKHPGSFNTVGGPTTLVTLSPTGDVSVRVFQPSGRRSLLQPTILDATSLTQQS